MRLRSTVTDVAHKGRVQSPTSRRARASPKGWLRVCLWVLALLCVTALLGIVVKSSESRHARAGMTHDLLPTKRLRRLRRLPLTPEQYAAHVKMMSCAQPPDADEHGIFVMRQVRFNSTHCRDDPLSRQRYIPRRASYDRYVRNHVDWSILAATLEQQRQRLQFPPRSSCGARTEEWEVGKFSRTGYAFSVHNMVTFMARHWDLNASVIVGNARYRYSSGAPECGGQGWSCLLSPCSSCAIEELPPEKVVVRYRYEKTLPELCKPRGWYNITSGRCVCNAGYFPLRSSSTGCARCADLRHELDPIEYTVSLFLFTPDILCQYCSPSFNSYVFSKMTARRQSAASTMRRRFIGTRRPGCSMIPRARPCWTPRRADALCREMVLMPSITAAPHGECILFTVTFCANPANNLTCSPK